MPRVKFDQLPQESRVWIFSAERPLVDKEQAGLLDEVDQFLDQWASHDTPLFAAREIRYEQFLFVAVDDRRVGPSGCSIDSLVRKMKELQDAFGVELVNHAPVLFRRGDDEIVRVARDEFAELANAGSVTPDTTVFDNTLTRLGDIREGRWETRASDSWHGRTFF